MEGHEGVEIVREGGGVGGGVRGCGSVAGRVRITVRIRLKVTATRGIEEIKTQLAIHV